MRATDQVELLLRSGDVIARADHPEMASTLAWMARRGQLWSVLPGVYSTPDTIGDPLVRMRAVLTRHPDAVLVKGAAARVSYWPGAPLSLIEVAAPTRIAPRAGYWFTRRVIPPELIVERDGLRFTSPDLTAIDLATFACADAIDIALRTRAGTLAGMHEALSSSPHRTRNPERRRLLIDSRDEPWSEAERFSHQLLRRAGIRGWRSNAPVELEGRRYYLDIAFEGMKLAIEIDGRLHETDHGLFESDRWRQNALVAAGWKVLRFTWAMLRDHPEVCIARVRRAMALRK